MLLLYFHLFPIALLFRLVCSYLSYILSSFVLGPITTLKSPYDPYVHVYWVLISEACQVYLLFVFKSALRVYSYLNIWEIQLYSASCEVLLLLIHLLNWLIVLPCFEMFGWFPWVSGFSDSLCVGCCLFPFLYLGFIKDCVNLFVCLVVCLSVFRFSCCVILSLMLLEFCSLLRLLILPRSAKG